MGFSARGWIVLGAWAVGGVSRGAVKLTGWLLNPVFRTSLGVGFASCVHTLSLQKILGVMLPESAQVSIFTSAPAELVTA